MTAKPVTVTRYRNPSAREGYGITTCLDCPALQHGVSRERCRQHVRSTGHRVRFVVEDVTEYGPKVSA